MGAWPGVKRAGKRHLALLGAAVLLVLAVLALRTELLGPAAPPPGSEYLPLRTGNTWTYSSPQGEMVMRVVRVQAAAGGAQIAVEEVSRQGKTLRTYQRNQTGLFLIRSEAGGQVEDYSTEPQPVLLLPPRPGQSWQWQGYGGGRRYAYSASVGQPQALKTPTGTFPQALPVQVTVTDLWEPDKPLRNQQWLAPGVGIVQWEYRLPMGEELTYVLSAYHVQ